MRGLTVECRMKFAGEKEMKWMKEKEKNKLRAESNE